MEFTERHDELMQETHDAVIKIVDKVDEHHKTLYGNGQPGLVRDHLKFKTQVKTSLGVISGFFTILVVILRLLK